MAGKRNASSDLNHTNWDREDEPEEAGTFKKASNAALQRRIIKTAKRRNPISSAGSGTKSVFDGFTAFSKTTPTSTAFGFLNNLSKAKDEQKSNGLSSNTDTFKQSNTLSTSPMFKAPTQGATQNTEKEDEYYAKLKGLNESVSNWIKKHVDANPFLNLKPVFKDYEKYFDELEKLRTEKSSEDKSIVQSKAFTRNSLDSKSLSSTAQKELSSFVFKPTEKVSENVESSKVNVPQFSFGSKQDKEEVNAPSVNAAKATSSFAFTPSSAKSGVAEDKPQFSITTPATTSAPTFSFGSATKSSSGFTFGSSNATPFTFSNVSNPPSEKGERSEDKEKEADEEDQPPKVEFTPVVEDGHIYTVRCKVFVKKDNVFGDRGVGNLYLKPVPDSEKVQLIVRADTNLGNLLCNFILSDSIPSKRMGKKDVMLVCLPTPESKPPPVPILLRVKSTEAADDLIKVLEKYKK